MNSKIWLMDATFKSAPKNFSQLFVIHANQIKKRIPLVYCLCGSKSTETYSKIFQIFNRNRKIEQKYIIYDFEVGLSKAIHENYPSAKIQGCYFHFSQIIWRRVVKQGNSLIYKQDYEYRKIINYLLLLAYVPANMINLESYKLKKTFLIQKM
ncbi:hypothetical protein DMUE_5438 [Dictyocoela muelleri]|nr:hypothetical protein DMUE_5438 [Dictyocoela muelleri]